MLTHVIDLQLKFEKEGHLKSTEPKTIKFTVCV